MLGSDRVPRALAAVLISLVLALTALVGTAGVASAQAQYILEIVAPASVVTGQGFGVDVEIRTQAGVVVAGCGAPVTLRAVGPPGSSLWEDTVDAVAGVASFGVTLGVSGSWNLTADAPTGPCGAAFQRDTHLLTAATGIPPGQPVAPCPSGRECEQTWNGGNIAATLIARSGNFVDPKFVANSALSCNGGHPEPDSVLSFDHDGNVLKKVKFALDRSIINKPLWRYRVCWYSDMKFIPRRGGPPVNKGLLRNCRPGVKAPCVLNKRRVRGGALIVVLAPPGDPKGYFR